MSGTNHAARRAKLEDAGFIPLWKSAGAMIEVWSWAKQGLRGEWKTWQVRREAL